MSRLGRSSRENRNCLRWLCLVFLFVPGGSFHSTLSAETIVDFDGVTEIVHLGRNSTFDKVFKSGGTGVAGVRKAA